jgi:hypothetical protein
MSRDHLFFKQHPLAGQAQLSTGTVPTPYHVYDGRGVFIGGTADLAAVVAGRPSVASGQCRRSLQVPSRHEGGHPVFGVGDVAASA